MNYAEINQHPEMKLHELAKLVGVSKTRMMVAISHQVRVLGPIWHDFVSGTVPVGNLISSQGLPRFGLLDDHLTAARTSSVDDFARYVKNLQRQAVEACRPVVLTHLEMAEDAIKGMLVMELRAKEAEAKLDEIRDILHRDSGDW